MTELSSWNPAPPETAYEPPSPVKEEKPFWRRALRVLILPALLAWKAKSVFIVLFKLKGFATLASMFVSVGLYAIWWGWKFALGFVLLLLVHEMGHVFVLRRQGIKASAPMFIPFLGAMIAMREMPKDAWREAQMAYGGPLLGSLGALACLVAGLLTDSTLLQALAFTGFLLNLFNLAPVVPLDGGRIMAAVHPIAWFVGAAALLALVVWWHAWVLLILFFVFILPEFIRRWKNRRHERHYYALSIWKRLAAGGAYLTLAFLLVGGMVVSYVPQDERFGSQSSAPTRINTIEGDECYLNWVGNRFELNRVEHRVDHPDVELTVNSEDASVYARWEGHSQRLDLTPCVTPAGS